MHDLVQKTLDQYKAGITVTQVQMLKVEAPAQVIDVRIPMKSPRRSEMMSPGVTR